MPTWSGELFENELGADIAYVWPIRMNWVALRM